jgi:hypothetical protein
MNKISKRQSQLVIPTNLLQRVEELETANDSTQYRLAVLYELVDIVNELPGGKQIYNRALNRYRLKYLRSVVLPRRTKELMLLSRDPMPTGIKQMFVDQQISLIKSVTRAIKHREYYESLATYTVTSALSQLFSKNHRQSPRLSILSPHHHHEKEEARCPNSKT